MDPPVGPVVASGPATAPSRTPLHGRYTSLVPLEVSHSQAIFKHLGREENAHRWAYLFNEPFLEYKQCETTITQWSASTDPLYFAVLSGPASDPSSEPVGIMSYMSIVPSHRRIEIGSIIFGEQLKRTRAATEAQYLLMKHAFEGLGNFRLEWKANHLNKPSLAAAERLGYIYEGIFRKHMVVKGRRRDTAWFSITDDEWPNVNGGLEAWLSEDNFDENGKQRNGLKQCRESYRTRDKP
ncbi:GNAT family acetyltransferase [Colletotrichum tofieldiae]|uniref:GNAT family acetyltransferase n=1 Tax=Colletotrichum tofieldiae TaxID=708197 RepID=A0A166SKU9_9PEZI|nr:GNAT family acetyltransferase [Colletotrichum tofieldiae]GKT66923.1 GNAT family acetyltransferase [Colletotrichum tofieldiae]GKT80464.1 GNAT family acetyltransferase [Colletotrichum tofieldiae]GKT94825.1 GNAT family acetyltransferase [Colletotrichum tofieldiae]